MPGFTHTDGRHDPHVTGRARCGRAPVVAIVVAVLASTCGGPPVPRGFVSGASDLDGLRLPQVDTACARLTPDSDRDGLGDACELALAGAFAPTLRAAPNGCDWTESARPPRLAGEYLFAVQRLDSTRIRISYLPAYYRDCGWSGAKCFLPFVDCSPHAGDSEFIVLDVYRGNASGNWSTEGIFLSAHCFGDDACRWYRFADLADFEWEGRMVRGIPVIWVAEGRHANYPSQAACDRGHSGIDTCDRNRSGFRFPVTDQSRNIGSIDYPFGSGRGCVEASDVAVRDSMAVAGVFECLWDPDSRFRGWQRAGTGSGETSYYRYLTEIAGHGAPLIGP